MEKVVRTICLFLDEITNQDIDLLNKISDSLRTKGFSIQTKRICLSGYKTQMNDKELLDKGVLLGLGEQTFEELKKNLLTFEVGK
ncbi:MAG: hypothetical protein WC650_02780 [Candidatus Doudnabacteria bacterium]